MESHCTAESENFDRSRVWQK